MMRPGDMTWKSLKRWQRQMRAEINATANEIMRAQASTDDQDPGVRRRMEQVRALEEELIFERLRQIKF